MTTDTTPEAVERLAEWAAQHDMRATGDKVAATLRALAAERDAMRAELADANNTIVTFAAPHAVRYAKEFGLPKGHLHPVHYDILARAGARMDSFIRAALDALQEKKP